ncbi:MAG: DUF488 domain-containing protein [Dehalococcoidia bacterium]
MTERNLPPPSTDLTVYTVGHSTHSIAEFVEILQAYDIEMVVDVRKIARSRHNPQFNEDELKEHLRDHKIDYVRLEGLGGLRQTTKASINTAWENLSFRGYADYMQTPEFREALSQLVQIAAGLRTVIMCAEAVPWRCHRSLIGDALLVQDLRVVDIMTEKSSKPHVLTPWAKVEHDWITYPKA